MDAKDILANFRHSSWAKVAMAENAFDAHSFVKKPSAVDDEERKRFRSKVKVLDIMQQLPEAAEAVCNYAEDLAYGVGAAANSKKGRDSQWWNGTYCEMERLPRYWRATFLAENYDDLGLTRSVIKEIDDNDSEGVNALYDFAMGINKKTRLPRSALDKEVTKLASIERIRQVGRLTKTWVKNHVKDGKINWKVAGCYTLMKDTAKNQVWLRHIDTEKTGKVPIAALHSDDVQLDLKFHDYHAKLVVEGDEFKLRTKFGDGVGPNAEHIVNEGGFVFQRICDDIAQRLIEEREEAAKLNNDQQVVGPALEDEIIDNTRKRRAASSAEALKRRRLSRKVAMGSIEFVIA